MLKEIYACFCLLAALTVVVMETLNINGRVGENVTIKCSDWNVWFDIKSNVKYFCNSPCSEEKDIILKAAYGETAHKKRIELTNSVEGLFVTFTNLQKSDSKKYYCGVERYGHDSFTEVNLKVTHAESSSPKTTPKTAIDGSTLSFADTFSSTMSSYGSDINADLFTSYILHSTTTPTTSATQGNAPYLILGIISIIPVVMFVVMLTRKMMKKQLMVVTTPQEDARESAGPEGVYATLNPLTVDKDQVYSTLTPTRRFPSVSEGVSETLHPFTEDEDQVYSTLTPTKMNAVLELMSMDTSKVS